MATAARLDTLAEIREKVLANERLDFDDGVALLETDDLTGLGELADTARRLRGGGDEVFFVNNLYLNFTNVCRVKCKFCAFAVTGKQPSAYTWEIDKLVEHAVEVHEREQYSEIHMVGGENPHLEYRYYVDLTRALHEALPVLLHRLDDPSVLLRPLDRRVGEVVGVRAARRDPEATLL